MTLVLSVIGAESIWLVADRRLTADGRVVREDARKIMFLGTSDAVAILAYAGLGATARGTEPAEWMSAVLRGRDWAFEPSLSALAAALEREIPPHLASRQSTRGLTHSVIIPAFVGEKPRCYSIDLAPSVDREQKAFGPTRWTFSREQRASPRFALAGSGVRGVLAFHGLTATGHARRRSGRSSG